MVRSYNWKFSRSHHDKDSNPSHEIYWSDYVGVKFRSVSEDRIENNWRRANDRTSAFETLYAIYSLDKTKQFCKTPSNATAQPLWGTESLLSSRVAKVEIIYALPNPPLKLSWQQTENLYKGGEKCVKRKWITEPSLLKDNIHKQRKSCILTTSFAFEKGYDTRRICMHLSINIDKIKTMYITS